MTNFEKVVEENIADYLKDKDISKLGSVIALYEYCVKFVKHLKEIRSKEICVEAVMKAVEKNTGSYWKDWVKPSFADLSK